MLFTQEQRGPKETVVCYDADSGREIWKAEVEARLEDPMGGPGPRATPTLADGALYVTGATGALLRLDAATGRDRLEKGIDRNRRTQSSDVGIFRFALGDGIAGHRVCGRAGRQGIARASTQPPANSAGPCATGADSYASPQLNTIQGEELVLMLSNDALLLVDPASGRTRLKYEWKFDNYRALQPHLVDKDTILLTTPMNMGARAIRITKASGRIWGGRALEFARAQCGFRRSCDLSGLRVWQ